MKKYFSYELKKNLYVIGVITLVMTILHVAPILISHPDNLDGSYFYINMLSVRIGIVAVIVPIWLTDYKLKRRSIDLYYALPLSHTKILAVRFLLGLIAVFIPYTVTFWLGALAMIAKINYAISAVWYVPFYFAALIPIYIIYSISTFIFTRANKGIDGFMLLIFWFFALTTVVFALQVLVGADFYPLHFLPFNSLIEVTSFFEEKIYKSSWVSKREIDDIVTMSVGFAVSALMSIGSTLGLMLFERKAKAENVGQISDSWFGYKVMLPLYAVCLTSVCILDSYISLFLIIIIATAIFFAYVLYRRNIKIGKNQAIVLCVSLLVGILLAVINTNV